MSSGTDGNAADEMPTAPIPLARYGAFLSYDHEADAGMARAIRRGLSNFARPWSRVRTIKVFVANESLSANPALWSSIQTGLDTSQFFILLASPEAAASEWVEREVDYWLRHRPLGNLLIAVTAGELAWDSKRGDFDARTNCLPPVMFGRFAEQPRWVDLREDRSRQDLTLRVPHFYQCIADLAATVSGQPKDELIGEDVRQHRRTRRIASGAVAVMVALTLLAAAGAVVAGNLAVSATNARRLANAAQARAEKLQRDATVQQLISRAREATGDDPQSALRLGLAAIAINDNAQTRAGLINSLSSTRYQGATPAHTGVIRSMASATGRGLLATVGDDRQLIMWNVSAAGHPQQVGQPIPAGDDRVMSDAFRHDGNVLATAGDDGALRLWDTSNPQQVRMLGRAVPVGGPLRSVAFSPSGTILATVGPTSGLGLWDVSEPANPKRLAGKPNIAVARAVAFSTDGAEVAVGDENGDITLWQLADPTSPQQGKPLHGHTGIVRALAFDPVRRVLASAGQDHKIVLWDMSDPAKPHTLGAPLVGHTGEVTSLAFSGDGRKLASGSYDGTALLWDLTDPARPSPIDTPLVGHGDVVWSEAFVDDGLELVTASGDRRLMTWDASTRSRPTVVSTGHPEYINTLTFSNSGKVLAASEFEGVVLLGLSDHGWGRLTRISDGLDNDVVSVAFSPDDSMMATGVYDGAIRLWDIKDPSHPRALSGLFHAGEVEEATAAVYALAFSPDGKTLAAGGAKGGGVALWDLADASRPSLSGTIQLNSSANNRVLSLAFNADGRTLAVGDEDAAVTLLNISDRARPARWGTSLVEAASWVGASRFAADGHLLATGSDDHRAFLWDVSDPQHAHLRARPLTGLNDRVAAIAFGNNGATLTAVTHDQRVVVWDVGNPDSPYLLGVPVIGAPGVDGSAALTQAGDVVSASNEAGRVLVWDLSWFNNLREHPIEQACARSGGGFSADEWQRTVPGIAFHQICPA